jgi:hypothetical protein
MAVISGADYSTIAIAYSNARDSQLQVKQYLFDSVYEIVQSNIVKAEVDLLIPFWNTYLYGLNTNSSPQSLLEAVRAINAHVLKESSHEDGNGDVTLDAYLDGEGVTVPQTWADLSSAAGYDISPGNIV